MNIPENLKYAESHEWIRIEGSDAVVGITDHAQNELSDVVYVELPKIGRKVTAGEAVAVVESVKAASDIYSPLAGTIIAVNDALATDPAQVNSAPYEGGWIFKLNVTEPPSDKLKDAKAYASFVGAK